MNERIKLLIEQSYDTVEYNYAPSKEFFNKQKFAQLIISECAEIALVDGQSTGNFDTFNKIQKHFGVSV
jgi:tellurite resistance protein